MGLRAGRAREGKPFRSHAAFLEPPALSVALLAVLCRVVSWDLAGARDWEGGHICVAGRQQQRSLRRSSELRVEREKKREGRFAMRYNL